MHNRHKYLQPTVDGVFPIIQNRGGSTTIEITTPEGVTAIGKAVCSLEDNFNHRVGNAIALGRALSQISVKKQILLKPTL
jgi:hypothetical protein